MAKPLTGRVAIITGAGRGIGKAIAVTLARRGASVVLAARTKQEIEDVKNEISLIGGTALAIPTDMSKEQDIFNLVNDTITSFGKINYVINNAGMATVSKLANLSTDDWDKIMSINVRGPFILCRECIDILKIEKHKAIINIGSVGARRFYVNGGAYAASKHALRAMSAVLSQEIKDTGIKVHVVNPGGVITKMLEKSIGTNRPDLRTANLVNPQEVADIIQFLIESKGNGTIDELSIRRYDADYWCY